MTSEYAALSEGLSTAEAIEKLRLEAPAKETIYRAYVIDNDRHLIGSVRLYDLILAAPTEFVRNLMQRETHALRVGDDQETAARQIARYDVVALPVLDVDDRIVGIVTHDDAMDVAEREATEDFHRGATVVPFEGSVRTARLRDLYRRRAPWLVLLAFGNLLSGAGIAAYQDTISAHISLIFFLPLLIASGGNAGAQASTLTVRAMATGDVRPSDWARLLSREVAVSLALGLTMAGVIYAIGAARSGPAIAVIVAVTMLVVVLAGSMIGMSLPFLLRRWHLDPATASGPLVTSIADVVGVVTYFAIATAMLGTSQ